MNYNHDEILDEMKTNGDNASDSETTEKNINNEAEENTKTVVKSRKIDDKQKKSKKKNKDDEEEMFNLQEKVLSSLGIER